VRPLQPVPPMPRPRPDDGARRARHAVAGVGLLSMTAPAAYTVQPGDTLSEVAREHGTSVEALAAENGIEDPDHLVAGTSLEVPEAGATADDAAAGAEPVAAVPAAHDVEALLEEAARAHGFSPRFVKALAWQESGWSQGVVSSAGAIGIMQVMPTTGDHVADHILGRDLDLDDPWDNVAAGVAYLDHLWQRTGGDVEETLAGYYQGLASVEEHGRFDDTERYIDNVLALRDRF
jgi:soluble lytic murein transglycosylase-like protein